MARVPSYINVFDSLKASIGSGEYRVGDMLPPEAELESLFGVSRTTVRKAVEMLSREGYVEVRQGRGTRILARSVSQNISRLSSITQTLQSRGYRVRPKKIYMDTVSADKKLADALELPEGSELVRLQRVQLADEVPVAIMENYINPQIVPGIENRQGTFSSFYSLLEDEYGIIIDASIDRITAKTADFSEAEMLQVPLSSALVVVRRLAFYQRRPVSYDYLRLRADRYEFEVNNHDIRKEF